MRALPFLLILTGILLLAGCGKKAATVPDSGTPLSSGAKLAHRMNPHTPSSTISKKVILRFIVLTRYVFSRSPLASGRL